MQNSNKIYMILTNGFDPDVRVYKEAKYLVKNGYEVTILCWDRKCEYEDKAEENLEGIKIRRFCISSKPGSGMKQIVPYIRFLTEVRRYLKNKEYSYIHCHDFDGIIVGIFTKKKKQKKIIFDMHEIYNHYAFAKIPIFHYILQRVIKKSDYIVYVNEEQIKDIKEKEKLIFLPNYPEIDIYNPIEKKESSKIRVNYIGSLRDYESLNSLIQLSKRNTYIEVGLYGTGVCYERLVEESKDLPVTLYGKYDGVTESGKIYRNTDILYCSYNPNVENWKNAYPIKLYEAIITRTPVIVSSNTIAETFVKENEIGESVEYGNIHSITEAIDEIINRYTIYKENIEKIANNYKWENIANNLKKIYHI